MAFAMAFPGDGTFPPDTMDALLVGAGSTVLARSSSLSTPPAPPGYDLLSRPSSKASRSHSHTGSRCGTSNGRGGTSSGRPPSGAGVGKLSGSASQPSLKMLPLRADVLLSNSLFEELDDGITPEFLRHHTGKDNLEKVETFEMQVDAVSGSQRVECLGEFLPNLKQMRLTQSSVCTIRDLGTGYTQLRVLWLCRSSLQDLGGITALPVLEELYIAFNDVRDLSPLCTHDTLQVLDVEGNVIEDFEEIASLQTVTTLRELTVSSNPVTASDTFSREAVLEALPQLEVLDDILRGATEGLKVHDLEEDDMLDMDSDPFAGLEDLMDPTGLTTSGSDKECSSGKEDTATKEDTESSEAVAELRKNLHQLRTEIASPGGSPVKPAGEPSEQELIVENVKRARRPVPNIWSMQSMTARGTAKSADGVRPCTGFCPDRRLRTAWSHSGSSTTYRPSSTSGSFTSGITSSSAAYSAENEDVNASDLTSGDGGAALAGNALSAIRRRKKLAKERGADDNNIRDMLRKFEASRQESCLSTAELELRRRQSEANLAKMDGKRPGTSDVRIRSLSSGHGRPGAFPSSLPGAPRESTWDQVRAGGKQEERRPGSRAKTLEERFAEQDFLKPTFSTAAGEALIID